MRKWAEWALTILLLPLVVMLLVLAFVPGWAWAYALIEWLIE